jgi:hypothetical protein
MASGFSQNTNGNVYSRHPTAPHVCVPPGDAAIVACQARVYGALKSTQRRDISFCSVDELGPTGTPGPWIKKMGVSGQTAVRNEIPEKLRKTDP